MLLKIYKKIYWSSLVSGLLACYFLFFEPNTIVGFIALMAMAGCGILALIFSIKALRNLPGKISVLPFFSGLFLIIGGILFDIVNTIIHSPDLELESNKVVLFLFEQGLSLKKIYLFSFFYQMALMTLLGILWANFLKAYPIILKTLPKLSVWKTILYIYSGPKSSNFDFFIGKVDYFHFVTAITPMLTMGSLYRWYLGLEWLDLVPISHVFVPIFIFASSIFLYTYYCYQYARKY